MTISLALNVAAWDLQVSPEGNIAIVDGNYAKLQDVASAVRLFRDELWYDRKRGMPYWEGILGKQPPSNFLKIKVENMAKTIPTVAKARCVITGFAARAVTGQILITFVDGTTQAVTL